MKQNLTILKTIAVVTLLTALCGAKAFAANVERPKLVVGIVVDQMRWDYLYRYNHLYTDSGFKRLMAEGYNCENTMINYLPSVTAIGHTSIYTGSVPAIHGIAGNNFYEGRRHMYCCDDSTVSAVGSNGKAGRMSPRNMLATTIGDELKIATDFKSKVIGVSIKDRAAILPAGHSADAAYWIDNSTGQFITSTYYMTKLPDWVVKLNKSFGKHTAEEIGYSSIGNMMTAEMGKAAIKNEALGQRGITDMLTISFSCTDKIGHKYATHSPQTQEIYVDLDQRLADFLTYLDNTIGKEQYLVFLTADHGAANNVLFSQEHGIPAQPYLCEQKLKELDSHLKSKFGAQRSLLVGFDSYRIYLDHEAIDAQSLTLADIKHETILWLKKDPVIAQVIDLENAATAATPAVIKEKIVNGYNHKRSGDIIIVLNPACYEVWKDTSERGTQHGAWNPYDCHIPFILMGWHVKPGFSNAKTYITDIAPTICSMIHIQMPNGCIGNSVF